MGIRGSAKRLDTTLMAMNEHEFKTTECAENAEFFINTNDSGDLWSLW